MPKNATIRLFHATTAGALPPAGSLVEGELALDALSNPARLWTQVPVTRDPSGRINLLDIAAGAGVAVGTLPPANPQPGWMWFDPVSTQLFVWYRDGGNGQWVVAINAPSGPRGPQGDQGVQGPAATVTVGTTTTLAPGVAATVTNSGTTSAAVLNFGLPLPALVMGQATAPIMLAAANGAVCLTGTGPQLLRIGDTVFCNYQGANKASITANTISIAEIVAGYRPTAAVTQAIQTPAINITVSQPTTGTSVFPDNPGTNVANVATGAPTRWVMRHGTQFAANAAISLSMQWRTADAMP